MGQGTSFIGRVLGHYLVLEQVGAGGMGIVFRGSDQQLERDVAIKVLPVGMLENEAARKRFRHEALTLAKLNHPNIGTVYEFGSQDGVDFLVMEYVGGIALDVKLGRGHLPLKDVLRLGFQLADGLASAHDHHVIHRDLKPANLRLTEDNRLKILDFGLAQFVHATLDLGATASISENKKVSGTLPYMSPEQLRGEVIDQRSDIWSAGAVLYELATGRRPFPSAQVPLVIDAILNRAPELPSALNPKISPGLEMVVLKCLDKDPERRYQSARELRVDLDRLTMPISQIGAVVPRVAISIPEGETVSLGTGSSAKPSPVASRKLKLGLVIAGVAFALTMAAFSYRYFRGNASRGHGPGSINRRRTVAVLNLRNSTANPNSAWLSTGLAEMLTTELAAGERLRTITGEQVAQMKMNLSLADTDTLSPQTLSEIGRVLGADLIVLGSYVDLPGGNLRLDLHLHDVGAGESLLSVKQTGNESDLFDLVSRAGAELREKCNAGAVTARDQSAARAAFPSSHEAAKLYAQGLAKLRVNEAIGARDLLEKSVEADPSNALAHSALAAAWSLLGYDENARLAAKAAYDLSGSLSREDRLLTEARYRETSKEWNNAAEDYRTLFGFFPDNLEYGLLLARAQTQGGKGTDALATVDSLRKLPPPLSDDARIELAASEAAQSVGDFKQGEAFARAAAAKARSQNLKLVLARALYQQGSALENLTDPRGAMSAVEEAGRIYQSVGDRYGLASTLEVTAGVLADHGDNPGALSKYREELGIVQAIGNRKAEASALNNAALILRQQGNSTEARTMFEKALVVFQVIADKDNYGMTLINIGGILQDTGDLNSAKKTFDQAYGIFSEINDRNGEAISLTAIGTVLDWLGDSADAKDELGRAIALDLAGGQSNPASDKLVALGDALQNLGNLPEARKNYDQALSVAKAAGDKSTSAYALVGLGGLELKAADLSQARKDYEEALSLRNELGEKDTSNATKVALAELSIEEGHADAAAQMAREAREDFLKSHRDDDQVTAIAVLARALVAEGNTSDAMRDVERAAPIAAKSQNLNVKLAFAAARAATEAGLKRPAVAKATLQEVLSRATKANYVGYELEFRFMLEELDATSGRSAAARTRLERLQSEARSKGYELIARKAAAASTKEERSTQ